MMEKAKWMIGENPPKKLKVVVEGV